jgi:hypothetical protein
MDLEPCPPHKVGDIGVGHKPSKAVTQEECTHTSNHDADHEDSIDAITNNLDDLDS